MNIETKIKLNRYKPRDYQLPILDALFNKNYRRVIAILPRRAGKDITGFNAAVRQLLLKPCIVYYIFPTYSQGRKVLFDGITNDGYRIIDYYLPEELVEQKNIQEMKIKLKNGSLFQIVGSDNIDSLMGTNPTMLIFSEYALQSPNAYKLLRPVLTYNDGKALFLSTPRGRNHLYDLYQIAQHNKDQWFSYLLTVEDTKHISLDEIERERREGIMSDDLILQEYYCSFAAGIEGAYYTKYIDKLKLNNQIGSVPWEPSMMVNTAWDIGVRDSTSIIFFQIIGPTLHIIDFYEKSKEGLEHYAKVLEAKGYLYNKHIAPHDIKVQEFGSGITRIAKARQLGIRFTVADDISIVDGIEAVRSLLPRCWFDETKCSQLIKALENYRQEYDNKKMVYKAHPLHDKNSHAADALRYLAVSLPKMKDSLSSQDLDNRYNESRFGSKFPFPFN